MYASCRAMDYISVQASPVIMQVRRKISKARKASEVCTAPPHAVILSYSPL